MEVKSNFQGTAGSSSGSSEHSGDVGPNLAQQSSDDHPKWQCNICTLENQAMALSCDACGAPKKEDNATMKLWSCKFCTLENSIQQERCLACGEWRYSCGPPVSAWPGPNVGT